MRKLDGASDVNISRRHKLRLGPFMRNGAHFCADPVSDDVSISVPLPHSLYCVNAWYLMNQ